MNETEQLQLYDCLIGALTTFRGIEQSLGYVTDVSNDYEMCQTLSNVLHNEIEKIYQAFPKCWKEELPL